MGTSFKNFISKYGGWFVRILGFIADAYTVITIKWSSSSASASFVTEPYWLLTLWFTTLFSYLAFIEWIGKKEYPEMHFKRFLFEIFQFNHPILLAPIALFFFSFLAIFVAMGKPNIDSLFILFFSVGILSLIYTNIVRHSKSNNDENIIKNKWNEIDKFIGIKIKKNYFITSENLYDLCNIYGINKESINNILFNYSMKHPNTTEYGNLCFYTEEGKKVYLDNCLINSKHFPNDRFTLL